MEKTETNTTEYSGLIYDGTAKIVTGESSSPRKCRFCGGIEPDVSFDNDTAHAISESLGNVNFICNDECKSCNHHFSIIEQGFYRAHAPMLMMCGIEGKDNGKRKNDTKSVAGGDCRISFSDKGLMIALKNDSYEKFYKEAVNNHIFNLDPILKFEKYKLIDVYKSLCKYVISMLPKEELEHFQPTIEWLMGKRSFEKLPNVVTTITQLTQHPILGYMIRQNQEAYPYAIGFFRFAMVTYLFIIPGANNEFDYPNDNWLLKVADKLHQGNSEWYSKDLNSDEKIAPKFPIEVNNIHLGKTCFVGTKEQFGL